MNMRLPRRAHDQNRNSPTAWPHGPQTPLLAYQRATEPARHSKLTSPHCLLWWAVSQSFHQALLQSTRPHATERLANLSCLDPTGPV